MVKGWLRWAVKNEWMVLVVIAAMYLRIPTLLEPYWYGDEGIYLTIGKAIRSGEVLYKDIHDNKPPLIYYVAAAANGDQFWYRFMFAGVNVLAVGFFAVFAKRLFGERKAGAVLAAWLFVLLTNIPLWEGNIGNAENLYILGTVVAAYFATRKLPGVSYKDALIAGLAIGIGGLVKIPALVELAVWPGVWLLTRERHWLQKSIIFGIAGVAPLLGSIGYFYAQGVGHVYLAAAGLQNAAYVAVWGPNVGIFKLTTRAGLTFVAAGVLLGLRQLLNRQKAIVLTWGVFALFAATLSGRPYPHYLLQIVPALATAAGLVVVGKKSERVSGAVVVTLMGLAIGVFGFWAYSVWGYYANFAQWATRQKTLTEYRRWFNPEVNNNYTLGKRIDELSGPGEKVFLWADEPGVYALANRLPVGKYTTRYHVYDFKAEKLTMELLRTQPPQVIGVKGELEKLPGLAGLLEDKYRQADRVGDMILYQRLN